MRLAKKSLSPKQAGRTPGDPSNPREGKESRPALSSRDKVMPLQLESGKGSRKKDRVRADSDRSRANQPREWG